MNLNDYYEYYDIMIYYWYFILILLQFQMTKSLTSFYTTTV